MDELKPVAEIHHIADLIDWARERDRSDIQIAYRGLVSNSFELVPGLSRQSQFQSAVEATYTNWEEKLLDDFEKRASPFLKLIPTNKLEWIVLAQHHGLPTRLLDWTESLLVALFFAVDDPNREYENSDAIVWQIEGNLLKVENPLTLQGIDEAIEIQPNGIYFPYHTTPRISAQQGCFTVHQYNPYGRAISLEYLVPYRKHLYKFVIPQSCKEQIRKELDKSGINYFTLFPDLDGLCQQLRRKYKMQHERIKLTEEE